MLYSITIVPQTQSYRKHKSQKLSVSENPMQLSVMAASSRASYRLPILGPTLLQPPLWEEDAKSWS